MTDTQTNEIYLSSSPHYTKGLSTTKIMLGVILALLPECVYGVILFGTEALVTILVSVASCVVFEWLFNLICKKPCSVKDCSAIVTGILLALVCPPTVPVWMVILGALVAIVIAKGLFGGIGANVFNPALTGRAFLFISFPAVMGATWLNPKSAFDAASSASFDAITSATILSKIKAGTFTASSSTYMDLFLGKRAGCIGETCILLILISFAFLAILKIIDWRAPLTMVGTVAAATFVTGLVKTGDCAAAGQEVLLALLTGGLLFGATFMVTDYATTPVTKPGRLVFGFGCGLITYLIRTFGGYPEGVMFSILIMNSIAPFLNNLTVRKYGYGKKGHAKPAPKKIVQNFDVKNAKQEETK